MSFDIYVQRFENGVPAGIPYESLKNLFSGVKVVDAHTWRAFYDDANWCEIYVGWEEDQQGLVSSLVVDRPCADGRLWDSLFRVLASGPWVLYFPSDELPAIIADARHAEHLPEDMLDTLGPITPVRSGAEIAKLVTA